MVAADLPDAEYRKLAEFRQELRRFLSFSETQVRYAGLEPRQHQLLLILRALPSEPPPTIGELAERMLLRHHSTVELVARLQRRGLAQRERDRADRRVVRVRITDHGRRVLQTLTLAHREELRRSGPALVRALEGVVGRRTRSLP
ncbi:MAG TPA: helix-turn-helix domain-containing protein [Kofleriaceae bacterium]|jgi:DNA-binding MarR family transcriptional regulator|nr:helix-turn-helix domain-containing protein [Kofleriaceae bacterium]